MLALLVLLLVHVSSGASLSACAVCRCTAASGGIIVGCASSLFQQLLPVFPANAISIDLSSNALTTIPGDAFVNLTSLNTLILNSNLLGNDGINPRAFVPVRYTLTTLMLNNNGLSTIPVALLNLTSLTSLTLAGNALGNLTGLTYFSNLSMLDVSRCSLDDQSLPLIALASQVNTLTSFIGDGNRFTTVPAGLYPLQQLRSLSLQTNLFVSLSDLNLLQSPLESLTVVSNSIYRIHPSEFASVRATLTTLDLSQNPLSNVDAVIVLSSLQQLTINFIPLMSLYPPLLSYMANLTVFSAITNAFSEVPETFFANNRKLVTVNLEGNPLVSLPGDLFLNCPVLSTVSLLDTFLTTLPETLFSSSPNVSNLFLSQNMFSSLPPRLLYNLTMLDILDLSGNQLTELDSQFFAQNLALSFVFLNKNPLGSVPICLNGLPNVNNIGLSQIGLSQLTPDIFGSLPNLRSLDLSGNNMSSCCPESLASLSSLDLSRNSFTQFPSSISTMLNAATINLGLNFLDAVPNGAFDRVTRLNSLNLNGNQLVHLPSTLFQNVTGLQSLDLSNNLGLAPSLIHLQLPSTLTYLNLGETGLTSIPLGWFTTLSSLSTLILDRNYLNVLLPTVFQNLTSLTTLYMGTNQIRFLNDTTFNAVPNLQTLTLGGNLLSSVTLALFQPLSRLQNLDLSNNLLTSLPPALLTSLPLLTLVDLRRNQLLSIPCGFFASATRVMTGLDLSYNNLSRIDRCWLQDLPLLASLSFSSNQLSSCDEFAFSTLTQLMSLDFTQNRLSDVPMNLPPSLTFLSLAQNRIVSVTLTNLLLLPELVFLSLAGNRLSLQAANLIMDMLPKSMSLDLSSNQLSTASALVVPNFASLDLSNNNLSTEIHSSTDFSVAGALLLAGNNFPGPACPVGLYGQYPACLGRCSPSCVSNLGLLVLPVQINVVAGCSGPGPADCCGIGYSGPRCGYMFLCLANPVVCGPNGVCVESQSDNPYQISCRCNIGFSYRPTNPARLAITNIPQCLSECPSSTFISADHTCTDCDESCEFGCNGPAVHNCLAKPLPAYTIPLSTVLAGALLVVICFVLYKRFSRLSQKLVEKDGQYERLLNDFDAVWAINENELRVEGEIGRGSFGNVFKAEWFGQTVAVKQLNVVVAESDTNSIQDFNREVDFLKQLRHRNIVLFFGAGRSASSGMPFLVLEYMSRGSLRSILDDAQVALAWDSRLSLATDIARGLAYLHSRSPPVLHRDLRAANVLVNDKWMAKIADFGESSFVSLLSNANTVDTVKRGTIGWVAPEVTSNNHSVATDVFSYGMVLWEIASRQYPFPNVYDFTVTLALKRGERPTIPLECPGHFADLIKDCWAQDGRSRPALTTVVDRLDAFDLAQSL